VCRACIRDVQIPSYQEGHEDRAAWEHSPGLAMRQPRHTIRLPDLPKASFQIPKGGLEGLLRRRGQTQVEREETREVRLAVVRCLGSPGAIGERGGGRGFNA